jgi:hypothetical protein
LKLQKSLVNDEILYLPDNPIEVVLPSRHILALTSQQVLKVSLGLLCVLLS